MIQVLACIFHKSALTVLQGTRLGWNKLQRKGTVEAIGLMAPDVAVAAQADLAHIPLLGSDGR